MKGEAILFGEMTVPAELEDAFNAWQDESCAPALVDAVPGALSAMRYRSDAGPHYLWVLELVSAGALDGGEARDRMAACDRAGGAAARAVTAQTRYLAADSACAARADAPVEPLDAPVIHCVFHTVPLERTAVFEDWLDSEQAPMLLESPDWLMVRRLDLVDCDPEYHTHLVLHYLNDAAALESDALHRARNADGHLRLAAEPWFKPRAVNYRRRGARFLKSG